MFDELKKQQALFNTIKHKTLADVVKVVDGICYVCPDSDEDYMIAVCPRRGMAIETTFYEADDFYSGSPYNYRVNYDGVLAEDRRSDD